MKIRYLFLVTAVLFPLPAAQAGGGGAPSPYAVQLMPKDGTGVVPQSVLFLPGVVSKVKIDDSNNQPQEYSVEDVLVMPGATASRDCTAISKEMQGVLAKYLVSIYSGIETLLPPNTIDADTKAKLDGFANGTIKVEDLPGFEALAADLQKKMCPDGELIEGIYELLAAGIANDGKTPILNPAAGTTLTTGNVAAVVKNGGVPTGVVTLIYDNVVLGVSYGGLGLSPHIAYYDLKDKSFNLRSFGGYLLNSGGKCKIEGEAIPENLKTMGCINESEPISITAVDLNGDGNDDLVVGDRAGFITVYLATPGAFFPFTSVGFIEVGEPFEPYGTAVVDSNSVLMASAAAAVDGKFYVYKVWLQDGVPAMKQIEVTTPDSMKGPFKITAFSNGFAFISAGVSPETQSVEFDNAITVYQLVDGEYKFAGNSYVQKVEETDGLLKSVVELSSIAYTPAKEGVSAGIWAGDYHYDDEGIVYYFPIEDEVNLLIGAPSTFTTGTTDYGVIDVKGDAFSNVAVATGTVTIWKDPVPPASGGKQKLPSDEQPKETENKCGNGVCDAGEDLGNCPEDCPKTEIPPAYDDSKKRDKCTTGPKKGATIPKTPYDWTVIDDNSDEEPDWCQCWQWSKDLSASDKDDDGVGDKVNFIGKTANLVACDNCDPQENQCKESTKALYQAPCYNPMQEDGDGDGLGDACVKAVHKGSEKPASAACELKDEIPEYKANPISYYFGMCQLKLDGKKCYVNDLDCDGLVDSDQNTCISAWTQYNCLTDFSKMATNEACVKCANVVYGCIKAPLDNTKECSPSGSDSLIIEPNAGFIDNIGKGGYSSAQFKDKIPKVGGVGKSLFGGSAEAALSKGAVVIFINQKKAVKEAITPFPGECIMEIGRNGKSPTGLGSIDTPYSKWIMAKNDELRKIFTEHKNGSKGNPNYHASDYFGGELGHWISRCTIPTGAAQQIAVYQTAGPRLTGNLFGKSGMRPAYPSQFEIASKEQGKPNTVVTVDEQLRMTVTRLATLSKSVDAQNNVSAMFLPNETPLSFAPPPAKYYYLWPSEHVFVKNSAMAVDIAEKASDPLMRIKIVQPEGLPSMSISEAGEAATPANVTSMVLEGNFQLDSASFYAEPLMGPSYYTNDPEVFIDAFEKALDQAEGAITFNEAAELAWKIIMTPGNKVVFDPFLAGKFQTTFGPTTGYFVLSVASAPAGGPGGGGWGCGLIRK